MIQVVNDADPPRDEAGGALGPASMLGPVGSGLLGALALAVSPALTWYTPTDAANRFGEQAALSGWEAFGIEDILLCSFALVGGVLMFMTLRPGTDSRRALLLSAGGAMGIMAIVVAVSRIVAPPVDGFSVSGGPYVALAAALLCLTSCLVGLRLTALAAIEAGSGAEDNLEPIDDYFEPIDGDSEPIADLEIDDAEPIDGDDEGDLEAEIGGDSGEVDDADADWDAEQESAGDPEEGQAPTVHPRLLDRVERASEDSESVI